MLPLGLSICSPAVFLSGAFVPSSASTAALLAALTGVYPNSLKQSWDDAIGAMEADGSWADFDILYPKGAIPGTSAENIADGYINWKSPGSFTLIPVNSPTNGNGYWQGDGSSSRLRTQYVPNTNGVKFLQDDASVWVWSVTDSSANTGEVGSAASPMSFVASRYLAGTAIGIINCGSVISAAVANSVGLTSTERRSSTDVRLFKNGAELATASIASIGRSAQEQWICGANSSHFSARRIIFSAWGASQSGREASIYSTLQTLFTAAGTI